MCRRLFGEICQAWRDFGHLSAILVNSWANSAQDPEVGLILPGFRHLCGEARQVWATPTSFGAVWAKAQAQMFSSQNSCSWALLKFCPRTLVRIGGVQRRESANPALMVISHPRDRPEPRSKTGARGSDSEEEWYHARHVSGLPSAFHGCPRAFKDLPVFGEPCRTFQDVPQT